MEFHLRFYDRDGHISLKDVKGERLKILLYHYLESNYKDIRDLIRNVEEKYTRLASNETELIDFLQRKDVRNLYKYITDSKRLEQQLRNLPEIY